MKKTILFDLDGTLTDSGEGIINCAILALEHFGLPIPSREAMRVFVGPPLHESFIKHGVPADQAEEAIRIYRSRYIPIGKFENTPYPGIRELLEKLPPESLIIDLASQPGGVDKKAAAELGCRLLHALSLPGKYAPETAGELVGRAVLALLQERGDV